MPKRMGRGGAAGLGGTGGTGRAPSARLPGAAAQPGCRECADALSSDCFSSLSEAGSSSLLILRLRAVVRRLKEMGEIDWKGRERQDWRRDN